MSILDKYPAPWTMCQCESISASNGAVVAYAPDDPGRGISEDCDLRRLILSAPELLGQRDELLAALKVALAEWQSCWFDEHDGASHPAPKEFAEYGALIARIEGET